MSTIDINCSMRFSILVVLGALVLDTKHDALGLPAKSSLESAAIAAVPAAKENTESMEFKISGRKPALRVSQILKGEHMALWKLESE